MNTLNWEVVIGFETHVQLATVSKIFSGAATAFGAEANRQASPVDLALPGVLPVMNRAAVDSAIKLGLAVGARIASRSVFARKNYFYPDLPKGYQISQYETPVVIGGGLNIMWKSDDKPDTPVQEKYVHLTRAHLEEDAGKSLHEDFRGASGIDLNRAGTPLLEIVTEPDMRSSREAVAYARSLHSLVMWLGICDGNMQEGSFRCDANVSVRPVGQKDYGTRCEIKNLNSFRFLERAIDFEVRRQIELLEDGGRVVQETRLYDPEKDETRSMRSKEDAHDYRYFPDPDLPPLVISDAWIAAIQSTLPELPAQMRGRFVSRYGLSGYDATALTASRELANWFEAVVKAMGEPAVTAYTGTNWSEPAAAKKAAAMLAAAKLAANWVMADLSAALNRDNKSVQDSPVSPVQLARLLSRITDGTISGKIAKDVFSVMWSQSGADDALADQIIDAQGLRQISDSSAIEKIVDDVLIANPKSVEEFRAGKERAFNALIGQIMKASKGKANPQQANEILRKRLGQESI